MSKEIPEIFSTFSILTGTVIVEFVGAFVDSTDNVDVPARYTVIVVEFWLPALSITIAVMVFTPPVNVTSALHILQSPVPLASASFTVTDAMPDVS